MSKKRKTAESSSSASESESNPNPPMDYDEITALIADFNDAVKSSRYPNATGRWKDASISVKWNTLMPLVSYVDQHKTLPSDWKVIENLLRLSGDGIKEIRALRALFNVVCSRGPPAATLPELVDAVRFGGDEAIPPLAKLLWENKLTGEASVSAVVGVLPEYMRNRASNLINLYFFTKRE